MHVIINRPERHNALSGTVLSELGRLAIEFNDDSGVRVVVLSGSGSNCIPPGDTVNRRLRNQLEIAGSRAYTTHFNTLKVIDLE